MQFCYFCSWLHCSQPYICMYRFWHWVSLHSDKSVDRLKRHIIRNILRLMSWPTLYIVYTDKPKELHADWVLSFIHKTGLKGLRFNPICTSSRCMVLCSLPALNALTSSTARSRDVVSILTHGGCCVCGASIWQIRSQAKWIKEMNQNEVCHSCQVGYNCTDKGISHPCCIYMCLLSKYLMKLLYAMP